MFTYDAQTDTYRCPVGEVLKRRNYNARRSSYEYKASRGVCAGCSLREGCTRSRNGRWIKRHERQEVIDRMKDMHDPGRCERTSRNAKTSRSVPLPDPAVWLQAFTMAPPLADEHSGLPHSSHTKYHDPDIQGDGEFNGNQGPEAYLKAKAVGSYSENHT